MLTLRRIEIDNFACFDNIVIEPSTDSERPLTVLRAENGSGKTTFLRALRWGMYGERALPGKSAQFSLHPAWWRPDGGSIETKVLIEFETDGSTRHRDGESAGTSTVYQLVRSVTTIGKLGARDDEPDFHRIRPLTQLMVRDGAGTWAPHTSGVDVVVEELLPWGLRDFFVMDADEAADFVGGSENKVMQRKAVIEKTTAAVHSLLGLDVFRRTSKRVADMTRAFSAQATSAIGDADLDVLQEELDQFRSGETDIKKRISDQQLRKTDLEARAQERNAELDAEIADIRDAGNLSYRLAENRSRHSRVSKDRKATLGLLAGALESTDLLASLARSEIADVYDMLRPLYERGDIPRRHLSFVRELFESGTCVCGQNLSEDGVHRRQVEDRIATSAEGEERANYLDQLHDAAKSLMDHATASSWESHLCQHEGELAAHDKALSDLGLEKRDLEEKIDRIDEKKVQTIRMEIKALDAQVRGLDRSLATDEAVLPQLTSDIRSREKRIGQMQRRKRVATDKQSAGNMAKAVVDVLERAYTTIQTEQVSELSRRMNHLFSQMASNTSDEDFDEAQRNKATLKMIAEVGLRSVDKRPDHYEIYALNSRGRSMPATEINGASRRVLALSFVLALCAESRTYAPLIADSLLNFMSGAVRRNTLRVTAENSRQPILLLTGSDLAASSEAEIVNRYAGATYTLTDQWDAIDAGAGGDVVHWTEQRQVSLVCVCGPREYCDRCERAGHADSPELSRRTCGEKSA